MLQLCKFRKFVSPQLNVHMCVCCTIASTAPPLPSSVLRRLTFGQAPFVRPIVKYLQLSGGDGDDRNGIAAPATVSFGAADASTASQV